MTRFFRAASRLLLTLLIAHCSLLIANAQAPKTYSSSEILQGLQKLDVLGSVMYIAAHPDDENTRLLAYLAGERHLETSYLSLTRGDGGQNLIGPELREQLGVIRTQELLAARRIDGAQQFFTRANDFGFSKTAQEALSVWNHEQVLADVVWIIRQQRPDVLLTRFPPDPRAGHGHHQASAIVAAEAFDAAGDPKRFPEQLKYVQVWQPKRLYWNTGNFFVKPGENMDGYLKLDAGGYNPLLGQSYGEIAAHSRSQHRSQGFGASAQRGEALEYFQFVKGTPAKTDLFEGIDLTWNRVPGGAAIGQQVEDVIRKYDAANPSASVAGLLGVYQYIIDKRLDLRSSIAVDEKAFWIDTKKKEINSLIQACAGLYVEATVNEPTIVSGGKLSVTYELINRSGYPLRLDNVILFNDIYPGNESYAVFDGIRPSVSSNDSVTLRKNRLVTGKEIVSGLNDFLNSQPYWLRESGSAGMYKFKEPEEGLMLSHFVRGTPENTPVVVARFYLSIAGKRLYTVGEPSVEVPVQYKHTDPVLGELYEPLVVVPPVLVNIPAARAYVFADQQPKPVPVTLRAGAAGVSGTLALQVPAGWQAEPASVPFSLKSKDEEQTVTFQLRPLGGAAEGKAELRAVATVGGQPYSRGIQTIAYPHIPTQTLFPEAKAPLVRLRVARGHTQSIGYLMGAGDQVPEALRQLGYAVTLLDPSTDLTLERLRRFDAVVLGIRAYNTVEQLKTRQPELLRYVEAGGTMVVQYVVNRGTVLPEIGPYPLTLSANRVTVENTPVTFLKPTVPLLSAPNQLTPADFATNWVQEQGLYYPSAWDAHYQPVIASHDPGEDDQPSAILVAPYGKGRYIYTGLALFRQLPAGVPGAYRILANLVESNQ